MKFPVGVLVVVLTAASVTAAATDLLPNNPPSAKVSYEPPAPRAREAVEFLLYASDPDSLMVQAHLEFGDGAGVEWVGDPGREDCLLARILGSNEKFSASHVYKRKGNYMLTARVTSLSCPEGAYQEAVIEGVIRVN